MAFDTGDRFKNFCIGFTRSPRNDFSAFAKGYHRAALVLSQSLLTKPDFPDFEAYPVVFLFRNALELYLKNIYRSLLEEVRNYRASVDKRLSALDKRSGKKTDKILVGVLIAIACLAMGFAVGFVLNSHWVRQQEETALQMKQAGLERELGEVLISGFQRAGAGDRKTLEKILLTGQRNEGYWKEVFSAIGDIAEERKKKR